MNLGGLALTWLLVVGLVAYVILQIASYLAELQVALSGGLSG